MKTQEQDFDEEMADPTMDDAVKMAELVEEHARGLVASIRKHYAGRKLTADFVSATAALVSGHVSVEMDSGRDFHLAAAESAWFASMVGAQAQKMIGFKKSKGEN